MMRITIIRLLVGSFLALVCSLTPASGLAADSVEAIVTKMKAVFEPARPSVRQIVISQQAEGEHVQWTARQARKELADGKRLVTVMLAPDDVKGVAYLVWEPKDKPSVIWMYAPAIRRVRELAPVDAYEHFSGTDFTYADLGFVHLHEQYTLLGTEEHNGVEAYKIEETVPAERAYYSRILIWVASATSLPLERHYFDPSGRLWKIEQFEDVAPIDGVPTLLQVEMKDIQGGTSTVLKMSGVRYDAELPDELFDPKRLPELAAHPVWQTR